MVGDSSKRRKCTAEVFSAFSRSISSSATANTRSISLTRTQHRSSTPISFSSADRRSSGSGNSSSSVTFQNPLSAQHLEHLVAYGRVVLEAPRHIGPDLHVAQLFVGNHLAAQSRA